MSIDYIDILKYLERKDVQVNGNFDQKYSKAWLCGIDVWLNYK